MGGAGPHNSHLNRRRTALKPVFQRAGSVCPCRGSVGRGRQKSFKYYTLVFSCNINLDIRFKRHLISHPVLKTYFSAKRRQRESDTYMKFSKIGRPLSAKYRLPLFKTIQNFILLFSYWQMFLPRNFKACGSPGITEKAKRYRG